MGERYSVFLYCIPFTAACAIQCRFLMFRDCVKMCHPFFPGSDGHGQSLTELSQYFKISAKIQLVNRLFLPSYNTTLLSPLQHRHWKIQSRLPFALVLAVKPHRWIFLLTSEEPETL